MASKIHDMIAAVIGEAIDAMSTNADVLIDCFPYRGSLTTDHHSGKCPLVSEPVICAKVNQEQDGRFCNWILQFPVPL